MAGQHCWSQIGIDCIRALLDLHFIWKFNKFKIWVHLGTTTTNDPKICFRHMQNYDITKASVLAWAKHGWKPVYCTTGGITNSKWIHFALTLERKRKRKRKSKEANGICSSISFQDEQIHSGKGIQSSYNAVHWIVIRYHQKGYMGLQIVFFNVCFSKLLNLVLY